VELERLRRDAGLPTQGARQTGNAAGLTRAGIHADGLVGRVTSLSDEEVAGLVDEAFETMRVAG
jgi:hypothetical protein